MLNPYIRYIDKAERDLTMAPPVHDGLAVASIIFAFVFFPLGIVFGRLSNREARQAGRRDSALATAGLVISYICIALIALALVATIA